MPHNSKGKKKTQPVRNNKKKSEPVVNKKTEATPEVNKKMRSEAAGKEKAKPESAEKSKSRIGTAMNNGLGYLKVTFSSKAKEKDNKKKETNLSELSDDDDVPPRESTLPRESSLKGDGKSYAQAAGTTEKSTHFSDSPQGSVSSRASVGGYHEDISGLVEPRALRRISSSGRTTEIDRKPAEPLPVERHNKIKLGSRVMVKGFMAKGTVRWLGMFEEGGCIAGLEMERSKTIYNDKYDDRSWFTGPVLREHYEQCDHLEVMEPETTTPKSYETSIYRNPHPASVSSNYPRVVELEETTDGRIKVGMRAQIKYTHHVGTVRWIGLSSREEWIGMEMDERSYSRGNLFDAEWFDCYPDRAEYKMASHVEPLPYEDFPSSQHASVHRDDHVVKRRSQFPCNSNALPNAHVRQAPQAALIVVETEKHGDYKVGDIVRYMGHYNDSKPLPGEIRFIGRVKDERDGTVYVGLDMFDFAYNRDDHMFDKFGQFEPQNMKPGCSVYCDIRDISALEDVPMEVSGEDGRRQERKGSDSRIHRHSVNTDTIKEEPSSEDISPDIDEEDADLYGAGKSPHTSSHTRHTSDEQENHRRPDDIDLKTDRGSDPLTNGSTNPARSRIGGSTSLWTRPNAKLEQGPELKKPPLRDLSQVKRVSQYKELEENAMVQTTGKKTLYGVIRWMGYLPGRTAPPEPPLVGIEMEEYSDSERNTTNTQRYGVYDGYQLFECKSGRGAFFNANRLLKDQRFEEVETEDAVREKYNMEESVIIKENQTVSPFSEMVLGRFKGIQGHHNSCYLDSTLYSMFAFTQVFDSILHRPKQVDDIPQYGQIQEILREKIVNPLRREHYVDARKVLELRDLLDRLSSVEGMMGEEKDPEEFLNSLLLETMKAEPFIKLSSGQASFMYQLFIEKEEKRRDPTVQDLLQMSFKNSKVKLQEVPPCLILQMPRFGRTYKMFDKIIPSPILDVTDILEPTSHTCFLCRKEDLTHWFVCDDCTIEHQSPKISVMEFCRGCFRSHEKNERYQNHRAHAVGGDAVRDRHTMELFSVVCIETSHYVTFTKCGKSDQWVFFDSMADRIGDLHGFNIPEVKMCVDMADKNLRWSNDPLVRRVLRDAYMCFYRSPVSEMYC